MYFLLGFLSLGALTVAKPVSTNVVLEQAGILPEDWTRVSAAAPEQHITLRISIRHPHQDYLNQARDVSDPNSPSYGRYLSHRELQTVLPDLDSSAQKIEQWLSDSGVPSHRASDKITISTTVDKVSQLLDAKFSWYQYQSSTPVLRTELYSIPAGLMNDIDFVYPTVHFLAPKAPRSLLQSSSLVKRQHLPPGPPNCTNSVCPKTIADAYQIDYSPPSDSSVTVGIASFLENYGNHADLASFLKQYGLANHSTSYGFSEKLVNGGINPQGPEDAGVESMLDLEYVMSFTSTLPVTFYATGGRPPTQSQPGNVPVNATSSDNEPYLEFLDAVLAEEHPPSVISISYSDDEDTVPLSYARKVCSKFAQLALRGVTVLNASGDGGATGTGNDFGCTGPNGVTRGFKPTFPSSCPWVTSVGATLGLKAPLNDQPASFSGGGFSNYFEVPEWQRDAVTTYQRNLGDTHKGFYNSSGRGIPDVSAMGNNYLIFAGGFASSHDGTSASTPVIAAIVALLNDLRTREGMPTLGFLNPVLYSTAKSGWTDITDGSAAGCSDGDFFEAGYPALVGWDAATGWGTPIFPKLRELLATKPSKH